MGLTILLRLLLNASFGIRCCMKIVDGGTIYRVLRYHKQCMAAALEVAINHTWIRDGTYVFIDCPEAHPDGDDEEEDDDDKALETHKTTIRTHPSRKHKNGYLKSVSVHPWWTKFMATTKVALSESIHSETIQNKGRVKEALSSASQCSHCCRRVKSDFSKFLEAFVNEVEERVNEVSAYLPLHKCRSSDTLDLYFGFDRLNLSNLVHNKQILGQMRSVLNSESVLT